MTAVVMSPVDAAQDTLTRATAELAESKATVQRVAERQNDLSVELDAAEKAAIAAVASVIPDDGSANRTVAALRAQHATLATALAQHTAAVDRGEARVKAAGQSLARARATAALADAEALVSDFEQALNGLIDAHAEIARCVATAHRHAIDAGASINPPLVIGRRIRHALMAAGIDVSDRADGPRTNSGAAAIREALQHPRWGGA